MSARLQRPGRSAGQPAGGDTGLVAGNSGQYSRMGESLAPPVDQELITYLRSVFPIRLSEHFDLRTYDRQLGAQEVINTLQKIHDIQTKE